MKQSLAISLVLILSLSTSGMAAVGQAQSYGMHVNNAGLLLGTGSVGSLNAALAGGPQHVGPAVQMQVGGAVLAGQSGGIATAAGFQQVANVNAGQMQVGMPFGPVLQMQGQSVSTGQTVGKTGAGPGGAAGMIAAGAMQGQSFGMGPMSLQQGSGIMTVQAASVTGAPGAVGVATQNTIVETAQMQARF